MPNPATNSITIEIKNYTKQKTTMEIKNVVGQIVYTEVLQTPSTKIDISHYPRGLYFIQVQTPDGIRNKKFVKE